MRTDLEDLKGLIEAYIFSQTEPVSEQSIESLLEKNSINLNPEGKATVSILDIIHLLQEDYAYRGIRLCKVAGGWQFRTAQEWTAYLVKIIARPKRLSRATMETLAVVAYHQPCTRTDIEKIRGVGLSQTVLETLLGYGLIKPCGYKSVPGRPTLWKTSKEFLTYLGLNDLNDLPKKEELFGDIPYHSLNDE